MTPTDKQTAYAAKLHARHCNLLMDQCKRLNLTMPTIRRDYRDEMAFLGLDPKTRRDVSAFIDLHVTAKRDAAMTLGLRPR